MNIEWVSRFYHLLENEEGSGEEDKGQDTAGLGMLGGALFRGQVSLKAAITSE
jgi:hypothetical protein